MKIKLMLMAIFISGIFLSGCASQTLKAPCDQYANFCGSKTKINQW